MKILVTNYYYNSGYKDKTKEDIVEIGKELKIFEDSTHFCINDKGILYTWRKAYCIEITTDIDRIAQALKITQEGFHLIWREIENEDTKYQLLCS